MANLDPPSDGAPTAMLAANVRITPGVSFQSACTSGGEPPTRAPELADRGGVQVDGNGSTLDD